jgi:anionic cell wall polymer biosynthesis LytR-Cps2A-Psr (LCP) family protein
MKELSHITFSMQEFKTLIDALGEVPFKYSAPIVNFLNKKAQHEHEKLNTPANDTAPKLKEVKK